LLAQGKTREAIAVLRRALDYCEKMGRADSCAASTQFALARAFWATRRAHAFELANKARESYRAGQKPSAKKGLQAVEDWLAARK
jgi:hypothetical protein